MENKKSYSFAVQLISQQNISPRDEKSVTVDKEMFCVHRDLTQHGGLFSQIKAMHN